MRLLLLLVLLLTIVHCDEEHRTMPEHQDEGNETSDTIYDSLLSNFDKDGNGNLSTEEVVTAMADAARQGGIDYGSGYYTIIRNIMADFVDASGEVDRHGAKLMEKSLNDGVYNQWFVDYFKGNPPLPAKK